MPPVCFEIDLYVSLWTRSDQGLWKLSNSCVDLAFTWKTYKIYKKYVVATSNKAASWFSLAEMEPLVLLPPWWGFESPWTITTILIYFLISRYLGTLDFKSWIRLWLWNDFIIYLWVFGKMITRPSKMISIRFNTAVSNNNAIRNFFCMKLVSFSRKNKFHKWYSTLFE